MTVTCEVTVILEVNRSLQANGSLTSGILQSFHSERSPKGASEESEGKEFQISRSRQSKRQERSLEMEMFLHRKKYLSFWNDRKNIVTLSDDVLCRSPEGINRSATERQRIASD